MQKVWHGTTNEDSRAHPHMMHVGAMHAVLLYTYIGHTLLHDVVVGFRAAVYGGRLLLLAFVPQLAFCHH